VVSNEPGLRIKLNQGRNPYTGEQNVTIAKEYKVGN
jgi:hypothetical protein